MGGYRLPPQEEQEREKLKDLAEIISNPEGSFDDIQGKEEMPPQILDLCWEFSWFLNDH